MGDLVETKYKCGLTKTEAHELLMLHKNSYLWQKPCINWTVEDVENLKICKNIRNGKVYKRHIRYQPVLVTFNDGTKQTYSSVKTVANKFKTTQGFISNVLAGRKGTTKFKSIVKI